MKENWKKRISLAIYVYGWAILLGLSALLVHTFLKAYASDGKAIAVFINRFGEANIELVLLSTGLAAAVFVFADSISRIRKHGW